MTAVRDSDWMVLKILTGGASYGYAIRRDIKEATRGEEVLSLATVYDSLHRLLEDGLIRRGKDVQENGRTRRTYEITGAGARALTARARVDSQLSAFVEPAR